MSHLRVAFFLALIGAGAAACSSTNPPPDVVDDIPVASDVPVDNAPPAVPMLFGNCASAADCLPGDQCLTDTNGWPGGFCTRACSTSTDCATGQDGVDGVCRAVGTQHICLRACSNGYSCESEGLTCHALTTSLMVCNPSCNDTVCQHGTRCNVWTSQCEPTTNPNPPPGVANGGPCTRTGMGSECKSAQCIVEHSSNGLYNGWNGGSCVSTCSLPIGYNVGSFFDPGDAGPAGVLPQANCPSGSVCFPNGAGEAERDEGICLTGCRQNSDCRVAEGYRCEQRFEVAPNRYATFMNGICTPMDCLMAGMTCPTGYMCDSRTRTSGGQTTRYGVCRPAVADAGTDGGPTDAASDAVTGDTATGDTAPADSATPTDTAIVDAALDASTD
jgi:hypothetical protein